MSSPRSRHGESRIWIWGGAITLTCVFFLATHDPLASLHWRDTLPEEVRALVREVSEGRIQRRFAFPLLATIGLIGLARVGDLRFRPVPHLAVVLGVFLSWQFLSVVWAQDPLLTAKRLVVLALLLVGAAGFVRRLTLDGLMRAMALCTTLHLVTGVGAELWLGTFEPLEAGYRFAGTLHPNQQGINCGILAISAAFLSRGARSARGRAVGTLLLCTAVSAILLTRSRTALAAVILALLFFFVLEAAPLRRISLATAATAAFALLALLAANGILPASPRAFLLGRSDSSLATFTGRTDIWSYALQRAVDRPIAGYGYNSFWSPRHTAEVSRALDWKISEGHSAYLDSLLNLGAVGLLLFVTLLALTLVVAVARFLAGREPAYAAAAALVAFGALDGLLESALVIPNLLSFLILTVMGVLACGCEPRRAMMGSHGVPAVWPVGMAA